jgi:1-acyl-sn-glycerol-3-phosphate acyltransferase
VSSYPPPAMLGPRAIARWSLRGMTDGVSIDGEDRVPADGPVLLAARHYHHLLDGAVLVDRLRRPVHIVVGLDWAADARQRRWMERVCGWARYPVILRPATTGERAGYERAEIARYLRRGLRDAAELLREGRVVLVFPEGYPAVDPSAPAAPRARDGEGFLPFAPGFSTIVHLARRLGAREVPIVPVGFRYEARGAKWRVAARLGAPLAEDSGVAEVERAVRALSR